MENQPFPQQSRRERREANRAARGVVAQKTGMKRFLRRFALWGGIVVVLAGIVWLMVRASNAPSPSVDGNLAVPVSSADNVLGPDNAPITLVEYADFQCPACATFHGVLKQLMADPVLQGKVRLVYRYFPLTGIHQNAQLSAQAAQAAELQGKFWEMHDKLFESQTQWAGMSSAGAESLFTTFAQQVGLDVTRWKADLRSSAVDARIQTDVQSANAANINATPTFFLNGIRVAPPNSYAEFRQDVISALPTASPTPHANP